PNTYKMTIKTDRDEELDVVALSVGGGMIEIIEIDHFEVEVTGGFYETLLIGDQLTVTETELAEKISKFCFAAIKEQDGKTLLHIKTQQAIPENEIAWLNEQMTVERFIAFEPVLPIMSQKEPKMLFATAEEMIAAAKKEKLDLADMALRYESHRGSISEEEVYQKAEDILEIMANGIKVGLAGTSYEDRMLGSQAPKIQANRDKLIGDDLPAKIIENISALMEVKSSMNVFVAAPTAGSCGALPGTLIAVSDYQKKSHDELVRALLAAGMIGVFIAEYATFAAEVAGCQAECGSGSGMTAGALV
ncbi:MAG: L-serine ammonia-lyase, iron-sulfur-dependent, subunit alpha, partial [Enterococcus hulanensis]